MTKTQREQREREVSFKLNSVARPDKYSNDLDANYQFYHNNGTTTLDFEVKLEYRPQFSDTSKHWSVAIELGELSRGTMDEALDKMADWLDRAAKSLKYRNHTKTNIPI